MPDPVTTIEENAFKDCHWLGSVSGRHVKSVGATAFKNCMNLKMVEFPNAIKIEANAFEACCELKTPLNERVDESSVAVPVGLSPDTYRIGLKDPRVVTKEDVDKFFIENKFFIRKQFISIRLPDSVERIDVMAFNDCLWLYSITGLYVEEVDNLAFANCRNLVGVTFPKLISLKAGFYVLRFIETY